MRLIDADGLKDRIKRGLGIKSFENLLPAEKYIVEQIDHMPTIQPEYRWIPVTERLPQQSVEVLTYTGLVGMIEIQSLEQDRKGFLYWENQHGDTQDMTVTAWMPLPKPYQPDNK